MNIETIRFLKSRLLIYTFFFLYSAASQAEILTISYLQRPPYYFDDDTTAKGILIDIQKKILLDAGIEANFVSRPPKRIIREMQETGNFYCSLGWFKNSEREKFAKFSAAIYENQPIVALLKARDDLRTILPHELGLLLKSKTLRLGVITDFSYGEEIDSLIERHSPNVYAVSGQQIQLAKMLSLERISYLLIAPEEIDSLLVAAKLEPAHYQTMVLTDVPHGNKRYLMCNQSVSDELMKRMDVSILKIVGVL